MVRLLTLTAAAALVVACAPPADDSAAAATPDPGVTEPASPAELAGLDVQPMTYEEFAAVVPPGLGCSFESGEDLLVVASGPDDNSAGHDAAIKIGDEVIALTGLETGGFDALVDGGTFEGSGVIVRITRSSDGRQAGIESTAWDAHLEAERSGRQLALTGTWSCGA